MNKNLTLRVTHQIYAGVEVEDAKLHLALNNGNQIGTTAGWRKEMLLDIQNFLILAVTEIDMASVDQLLTDVEAGLSLLEMATIQVLDDVFYFTEMNLPSIFVHMKQYTQYVKEWLGSIPHVNMQLIDYLSQLTHSILDFR